MITQPLNNDAGPARGGGDDVTLTFGVETVHGSTVDATWWPRTATLVDDLPPLIVALRQHGVRISRVSYNPALWEPAPNRIYADGRTIRLGWFASIDPDLLLLSDAISGERLTVHVKRPGAARSPGASTAAA